MEIITDLETLRRKSLPTSIEEMDATGFWAAAEETMDRLEHACGVTANQLGHLKRAFIARIDVFKRMKFINPVILERTELRPFKDEGCLSFPGKYIDTARHWKVRIKDDVNGEQEFTGFLAAVMEHEVDHLDGVLYMDRQSQPVRRKNVKVKPNEPCPCGRLKDSLSDRKVPVKYKHCCGK